jgi:hypothetical protein
MTLAILVAGALLVMRNDGFSIGMLVAFQMFAATAWPSPCCASPGCGRSSSRRASRCAGWAT